MERTFSVTEFNKLIKSLLNEIGTFTIKGEITEFTITTRKGVYMTLSDGKSNIKLSGYAPSIKGIDLIEKKMSVLVKGMPDLYVPYGTYSFSIFHIEPEGEGSLAIAYEKLKQKLEQEGLFSLEYKKELPDFVTRVALLTGEDSAAYSDFSKILKESRSGIQVDFYPVIVQGPNSVESIINTIEKINIDDYDALVLTRGGGSAEDLKSFNDEDLAQKIFIYRIPVIIGVGHEKDESIADFVADIRASTPSQCAYYLVDHNLNFVSQQKQELGKIHAVLVENLINNRRDLDDFSIRIFNLLDDKIQGVKEDIQSLKRLLKSYDIESILKRGYAIVKKQNVMITSIKLLKKKDKIDIRFQDGETRAEIIS